MLFSHRRDGEAGAFLADEHYGKDGVRLVIEYTSLADHSHCRRAGGVVEEGADGVVVNPEFRDGGIACGGLQDPQPDFLGVPVDDRRNEITADSAAIETTRPLVGFRVPVLDHVAADR